MNRPILAQNTNKRFCPVERGNYKTVVDDESVHKPKEEMTINLKLHDIRTSTEEQAGQQ